MKVPEYLKSNGLSLNLTPMIDVVFLLIIFFIVASNLIQQDVSMPLDLPAAETAAPMEESETRKITINVPKPGTVFVGVQPTDPQKLRELFNRQRQTFGEDSEIRIRTNKDVPYGAIEPILVLAAECQIRNVSFAVAEKR